MSITTAWLRCQILEVFDIDLVVSHSCRHYDPNTGRNCSSRLSAHAVFNAYYIATSCALQSPSNSGHDIVHSFSFIETLQKLATCVLCRKHSTPIIITNTILSWLDAAVLNPDLFKLGSNLRILYRELQIILLRFARDTDVDLWRARLTSCLHTLNSIPSLHTIVLETIEDLFDPYFENFAQNIMDAVIDRLASGQDGELMARVLSTNPILSPAASNLLFPQDCSGIGSESSREVPRLDSMPATSTSSVPPIPARSPLRPTISQEIVNGNANLSRPQTSNERSEPESDCRVCYEPLASQATTTCSTCRKSLHLECMREWARTAEMISRASFITCPYCRSAWQNQDVGWDAEDEAEGQENNGIQATEDVGDGSGLGPRWYAPGAPFEMNERYTLVRSVINSMRLGTVRVRNVMIETAVDIDSDEAEEDDMGHDIHG